MAAILGSQVLLIGGDDGRFELLDGQPVGWRLLRPSRSIESGDDVEVDHDDLVMVDNQ